MSFPDIEVVWTGKLSDVGPGNRDERLHIRSPYIVFSYNAEEILSDPIPLKANMPLIYLAWQNVDTELSPTFWMTCL